MGPTAKPRPLPDPPLLRHAIDGADEPMVLSAPPAGRSGLVKVRKRLHDVLEADPASVGPHVVRLRARFEQGKAGERVVSLRIDLGESFPDLPLDTLPERLRPLIDAGRSRCAAVLGADFRVLSIYFGGRKLR